MWHLGSRVSALVDGELPPTARDHALAHCNRCAACRRAVAAERWLKLQHRSMSPAEPSATLLGNLFAIGRSADLAADIDSLMPEPPPADGSLAPATFPTTVDGSLAPAAFPTTTSGGYLRPTARVGPSRAHSVHFKDRGRAAGLLVAGAGSVTAAVFGLAYVLGGPADTTRPAPVTPEVDQFSAEFSGTSDSLPFTDPALSLLPAAFSTGRPGHR
jgi:anti-sigma factor RsiW